MAEPEGEEKLIAEFREIRHKKQLGVLLLTTSRVAWAPGDIVQTFQADYPYQQIKAQRISAETSSKIQLQLVLHAGTHANFHFTASNAREQRQEVKEHLVKALSKAASIQISPELEAKNNLLKNNPGIYQLYKDLVTTGLISTEEFWANQSLTADPADSAYSQESGLPSAFLADVQAVYDGCNAVRYNLSADVIQAIFKTYPTVKKKHAEMVPHQMKDEQFWTQFFQSQLFHHENRSLQFADCLSGNEPTARSPTVDMNLTECTSSILKDEGIPESESTTSSLVQRCNHHSNRVLEALQEGSMPSNSSSVATPNPSSQPHLLLTGAHQPQLSSMPCSPPLLSLANSLASWQLQQEVETNAAHAAIPYLAPGGSLLSNGSSQKASTLLTVEQQQLVFRHQAAIGELVRHFWSCFPVRTPQLEVKVHKMHQCLVDYGEKQLGELEGNTDSLRTTHHLHEIISTASQHYRKWSAKKKTSHRTL